VQESKCAIKFVRALLTNFLIIKNLIWKIDKSMMNILGIAKMLIGRYGGHIGLTLVFGSWMHE
jgi:hypothetical protein